MSNNNYKKRRTSLFSLEKYIRIKMRVWGKEEWEYWTVCWRIQWPLEVRHSKNPLRWVSTHFDWLNFLMFLQMTSSRFVVIGKRSVTEWVTVAQWKLSLLRTLYLIAHAEVKYGFGTCAGWATHLNEWVTNLDSGGLEETWAHGR